jgi:hypothetical protein
MRRVAFLQLKVVLNIFHAGSGEIHPSALCASHIYIKKKISVQIVDLAECCLGDRYRELCN